MNKTVFGLVVCFAAFLGFSASALAGPPAIVDIKGKVFTRINPSAAWKEAERAVPLEKGSEVETIGESMCTIALDEELKNTVVIKDNSRLTLTSVDPVNFLIAEGKVFSLIDDITKVQDFRITTPTAVAGVRGTGWVTEVRDGKTTFLCFAKVIYTKGLDAQGNVTGEKDVSSGFGQQVVQGGVFEEPYALAESDYRQWDDFVVYVAGVRQSGGKSAQAPDGQAGEGLKAGEPDKKKDDKVQIKVEYHPLDEKDKGQ